MKKKNINYKNTINLPTSNFPMKANLKIKEKKILKKWKKIKIYDLIKIYKNKNKIFNIHDGPPYANGKLHLGHALNKIIKDIILKYKLLMNYNINYVPGWDCHGLPIELKIQKNNDKKISCNKKIKQFKKKCYLYVKKQINIQKKEFIRLGIIADWNNYYKTMDYNIISNTIKILRKFLKFKYLKRKKKPINWCINCKSSLSELEIIYKKKKSKTIYFTFNLYNKNKFLINLNIKNYKIYKKIKLIAWTTTPWTIPSNSAISINPNYKYSLIDINNNIYIIINNKTKNFCEKLNIKKNELKQIKGKLLSKYYTYNPISKNKIPILKNKYINSKLGTGIVHLSPSHGEEDYNICEKYNIKNKNIINKHGKFIKYKYLKKIENCSIKKGQKLIIKYLHKHNKIIIIKNIKHKFPFCWRHKTPIIIRSSYQWFIKLNNNKIKNKLLHSIKKIKWIPSWGYKKIKKMIINRPDWCISRQRYWGTPITIFINKKTNKIHPKTYKLMKYISKKIKIYGPNYWLDINTKKILKKEYKNYKKVKDVLDVWFDSGSTIFTTINKNLINKKINIIIEGLDQYRGWFMSSIIINTLIYKNILYKKILSHGFIIDKYGNKMSKSKKNYINIKNLINKYGADIIRLWISSTKFFKDINISNEIISRTIDLYRKIRNTFKFLISNLNEYNIKNNFINYNKMILIDKWIINKAKKYQNKIINLYSKFKFYKIIKLIIYFCNYYLSSIYFDIIKDRKYIIKKNTLPVNSAQTTFLILLEILNKWIAPILTFTSEEIFKYIPRKKKKSIYLETFFNKFSNKKNNNIIENKIWNKLILIKKKFNKIIENMKNKKLINSSLDTYIIIYLNNKFFEKIKILKYELKYFFITSKLKIKIYKNKNKFDFKIKCKKNNGKKCLRCWNFSKILIKNINICKRCFLNVYKNGEIRKFI